MENGQSEFWADFDCEFSKYSPIKTQSFLYKSVPMITRTESKKLPENFNVLLEELKHSKKISKKEIELVYSTERKATIDSVQQTLNSIREKLNVHLSEAKEKNIQMMKEINEQSKMISILSEYLNEYEFLVSETRIFKVPQQPRINLTKYQALKDELYRDMEMTKLKILSLKEGIQRYTMQTEGTNKKIHDMKNFLVNCKVKYEKEIKDFELQGVEIIKQAKEINLKLKLDFETVKKEKNSELELIEKKCLQNDIMIASLRDELKAIKEILNYPVLKLRVHEKLKDYLNDLKIPGKINQGKSQIVTKIKPMSVSQDFSIDLNFKSGSEEISPFISKINLTSRKNSSAGTRTKLNKSRQILNSFDLMNNIRTT
jgi:hypothetical protein